MTDTKFKLAINEYAYHFLEFVTAWNRAENQLRLLLNDLIGRTEETFIVVVEMKSQSLEHALQSYAADKMSDAESKAITRLLTIFNRIRIRRNYLVHGLSLLAFDYKANKAVGEVYALSARKRFRLNQELIYSENLEAQKTMVKDLNHALIWMRTYVEQKSSVTPSTSIRIEDFQDLFGIPDEFPSPSEFPLAKS